MFLLEISYIKVLIVDAISGAKEEYEKFIDYIAKPFSKDQIKENLDIIFKGK